MDGVKRSEEAGFRPRARLLLLLGDELIRDSGIAVFELVKNAYDADATEAVVTLYDPTDATPGSVIVQDDGTGMDWATVTGVWLEPGTDFRTRQRTGSAPRTSRHHRLPLGEKGVGRFAAGKLGHRVTLVTRAAGEDEVVVEIDWAALAREQYLSEAKVFVSARDPQVFSGERTGTQLLISELREPWTRGRVRELHRAMTSITSPFQGPAEFVTRLELIPDPGWLRDLPDPKTILDQALYRASGSMRGDELVYDYLFDPPKVLGDVAPRAETGHERITEPGKRGSQGPVVNLEQAGVGPVEFDFRVFDLEPRTLQAGGLPPKAVRDYLRTNGGVRVYRDGVRVFDYGERSNDWLDLGARRVNVPGERLSNNQLLGAVHLSLEHSRQLVEKTNREGFVENEAYRTLVDAVRCALDHVTAERNTDKLSLRKGTGPLREPVTDSLNQLRGTLEERGLTATLGPDVDRIEREYAESRERLLAAAGTGLQLMLVVHEVEKSVGELVKAVERDVDVERLRVLTAHLAELITGLGYLTRRSGRKIELASVLVQQSLFNTEFRLRAHEVRLTNAFAQDSVHGDFRVRCTRRLIVATIMNLIDNAIYWSDVAATPRRDEPGRAKRLYIGPSGDLGGPAIVVADNGSGFRDDPAVLTQALVSRRPDGMGIGLHLADQVMRAHGGHLAFPDAGDVGVPPSHGGAVVALVFTRQKGEETA